MNYDTKMAFFVECKSRLTMGYTINALMFALNVYTNRENYGTFIILAPNSPILMNHSPGAYTFNTSGGGRC